MINFTSRQLRAFLLVAHHRSFSRAAEALFITPSGLSVLIRELEAQLEFRLFDRTTRSVALTSDGHKLVGIARRAIEELDTIIEQVRGSAAATRRSLAIGATPLFAAYVLPGAINGFHAQRQDVQIRLFDGDRTAIIAGVEDGSLDLGLGVFFKPIPGLQRTPLFEFSFIVIREAKHPGPGPETTWSAIRGEPLISLPPTNPLQQFIDKHLAQDGGVSVRNVVMNHMVTQIAMVEAGEGIAVMPSFALPACRSRRVAISRLVKPAVTLDFYRIHNRAKKGSACASDFTSFLQSYVAQWAGGQGLR
jgi:LysR family transcriptional regulator, carnitine catabolism transcriptional activator